MFTKILVPLDQSLLAECALPHAVAIAQVLDAKVTFLTVLDQSPSREQSTGFDVFDWTMHKGSAQAYLDGVTARLRPFKMDVETELIAGSAADTIIQYAHTSKCDLIIMSSHGRSGLSGWNISSVVQKVLLRAIKSVLIVPAYLPTCSDLAGLHYDRIFVPLDGSPRAEWVLPVAGKIAGVHHAKILLAHVVSRPEMPSRTPPSKEEMELADRILEHNHHTAEVYLAEIAAAMTYRSFNVQVCLVSGENPLKALHELEERENADLIILSAHGYSGDSPWPYGSVALSFIVYGATPTLILQDMPPDRITPTRAELATREKAGR